MSTSLAMSNDEEPRFTLSDLARAWDEGEAAGYHNCSEWDDPYAQIRGMVLFKNPYRDEDG